MGCTCEEGFIGGRGVQVRRDRWRGCTGGVGVQVEGVEVMYR